MEASAHYYFYSAAAQVFAALAGILAVFAVYALEWVQHSIQWSREDLTRLLKDHVSDSGFAAYTVYTQLEMADKVLPSLQARADGYSGPNRERLLQVIGDAEHALETIRRQRRHREKITEEFKGLLAWLLVTVAAAR